MQDLEYVHTTRLKLSYPAGKTYIYMVTTILDFDVAPRFSQGHFFNT